MNGVVRAGWALGALFFATVLASLAHVDHTSLSLDLLLLAFAVLAAIRPAAALEILAAVIPVAWFLFSQLWNHDVSWAEALVLAALAGMSAHAALKPAPGAPASIRGPALLFGLVVIGSMVASLGVPFLRLGPGFREALATQILREYFVDIRGFPALHAGMLLLEGVLLLVLSARISAVPGRHALARVAAMTAVGATLAAAVNLAALTASASRADAFWSALAALSRTIRWNVHYTDFNAAGSVFAMAALTAGGLAWTSRGRARVCWVICTTIMACALWLTASRAAYLALILALGGAIGIGLLGRTRQRVIATSGLAAATVALILVIAVAAPMRGNQYSSFVAAGVRVGMARVAGAMIAERPAFGIGLGEFYRRSGEFATPELIASFPVAVNENAHNNFLQVAAELGLIGGVTFVWLVGAALLAAFRRAADDHARLAVGAGLAAFVITWLAGHPLLVPEASYAFWILAGVAAGSSLAGPAVAARQSHAQGARWLIAACAIAIVLTVPWRMRALIADADFEHLGIGLSTWQLSPDGTRYRQGEGHATLFVPAGPFKFRVNPRTDATVRLEIKLDGRIANVVSLAPGVWNEVVLPARSERTAPRFIPMELTLLDDDQIGMWVTKVEPIQ